MTTTEMAHCVDLRIAKRVALAMVKSASLGAERSCLGHRQSRNNAERRFFFRTYLQFTVDWRTARAEYAAASAELATIEGQSQ
ncbi:hypothetical protein [Lacipirellula sp.]|uniref:hypothetical protein n=1 Tax=Lacipirellula sp. TaxID=2691419 RepID=UPI003D0B7050